MTTSAFPYAHPRRSADLPIQEGSRVKRYDAVGRPHYGTVDIISAGTDQVAFVRWDEADVPFAGTQIVSFLTHHGLPPECFR